MLDLLLILGTSYFLGCFITALTMAIREWRRAIQRRRIGLVASPLYTTRDLWLVPLRWPALVLAWFLNLLEDDGLDFPEE